MNNKKIVALVIGAFLVGDAQAVVRANRKTKRMRKENEILNVKIKSITELLHGIKDGESWEDIVGRFDTDMQFIDQIAQ